MAKEEKIEYDQVDLGDASKKIEKLRKILKICKKERQEYLKGWQRARADHQNYIKQKDEEMREFKKFTSEGAIVQIIPILDNLILACESIPESIAEDNWAKGIVQIRKHFETVLSDGGVEAIDAKLGEKFDPAYHEGTEEVEGTSAERGTIAEVLQRGYTLHGRVIRATRVKVTR